jgi:type VI secretion system protein ImpL
VRLLQGGQQVSAAEGPWALFRLIDKGTTEAGSGGDKLRVSFPTQGGTKLTLELRTGSSAFNPFRLRELASFACPRE